MKGVFWLVSFEKLLGMEVISSKARILGEVKGLEINTENWKATNLHVKLDNEVAVKQRTKKMTKLQPLKLLKVKYKTKHNYKNKT